MFVSHTRGSQTGPSSSCVLCICYLCALKGKVPSQPCFHQRPAHRHLPPEDPTLRYDPIFRVISDWFHLLLRKWRTITKVIFKPYIFSSKLFQAHFLLPYNFGFSHSRCSSTLTSPSGS